MASALLLCLVIAISDGDTLTARCETPAGAENIKVRIAGIDAPEKAQAFGQRSRQNLADPAFRKPALVEARNLDRYGRTIARVMVAEPGCLEPNCPKTVDVGLAQLTVGLAWWYRKYAREQSPQEQGQYECGETEAKARHAGLWQEPQPTPPWEWRGDASGGRASSVEGRVPSP